MTATFQQPDYTTQSGTAYPLSIDAAVSVLAELARHFAPHESGSPGMWVVVDNGRVYNGATRIDGGGLVGVGAADPTNPRIDLVVLDLRDATMGAISGAPAPSPVAPAPNPWHFIICEVYVAAGATAIYNADITDKRSILSLLGGGTVGGSLTIDGGGPNLKLKPGAIDAAYVEYFADSTYPNSRSAYIGFPGSGSIHLDIRNEETGGHINLDTSSAGEVRANGNRVLTTADDGPAAPAGYTKYSSFYMVNDVPAVNAPALNVDTVLAKNTWVSVGPTGSGATYTWTALDAVPATAKLVELRGLAYLNTLATTTDTATLQARKTGTATNSPWIFRQQVLSDGTTRAYDNTEVGFKVQIDTNRRFDLLWDGENFGGTVTIILYLVGWYE
ncbi:MAG: hypothetical protein HZA24_00370 [Nitrospirae bacterium]|nr:hypothetical protein [Nitrospirota bacterium]